ncbi:MAG: branched-chain amino acid ABC transporter permease, partial [Anaerolineae bacterium]|nr:branched-chain amino acid ABC transporter permease [Anaerolineae bacterium]
VGYTVDPLLMTIIGGVGTFGGPVVGATGLHLLDIFLRDSQLTIGSFTLDIASIWGLLLGVVFVLAVIVFPFGVIGTWRRWRAKRQ